MILISYHSWTVDGYGISVDDISGNTKENTLKLIHMAPEFEREFIEWANDNYNNVHDMTVEDIEEYESCDCYRGIGAILREVINECESIYFTLCDDYGGYQYILYEPRYPWNMNKKESLITSENIDDIFHKYVNVLTQTPVKIEYYSVENGG